jgi:hypothetical protein
MKVRGFVLAVGVCALPGMWVQGCSGSSRRTTSTAAAVTSSTTAATTSGQGQQPPPGPLAQKAHAFETIMDAWHLGLGQVQNVRVDSAGTVHRQGNAPSRCLWTGIYAGSQAMRYKQTQDPDALRKLEQSLQALHDMHEITGLPGVVSRGFDDPAIETRGFPGQGRLSAYSHNRGTTSRDQYAGWFYGIALGYDLVQDPVLRSELEADVRAVADKLIADNLKIITPWGPQGTVEVFFSLRPDDFYQDQINAQNWATVDDFPFNLITKAVPYSQPLADAIKQAPIPPVRAGEALRAVFFFTVAEHVTKDPRYGNFKNHLLHQQGYLKVIEDYLTFLDDVFYGRNTQVVEATLRQMFVAIGHVMGAYLQATGKGRLITQVLVPAATGALSAWLSQALVDVLNWVHDPNNAAKIQRFVQHGRTAVALLNLIGQQKLAQQIDTFLNNYGAHLSHQGLIDFARTVRSHLGANLTVLPMSAMIQIESDPQVVDRYKRVMERYWDYIKGDHNPIINLTHAGYGLAPGPNDLAHSIEALRNYPVDMSMREVDNSNWPGLVVSPWPDRMGKVGNHALVPDYFPINHRAPDIFPWRGHPRAIKKGSNSPSVKVAPLGYLSAYWLAREVGAITAAD